MNLFGSDDIKSSKFEEIGNKLLEKPSDKEIIGLLKELKGQLSIERQEDLKNFIQILVKASESSKENKMDISNLVIVAGPNLCDKASLTIVQPRQKMTHQLIAYYDEVFES